MRYWSVGEKGFAKVALRIVWCDFTFVKKKFNPPGHYIKKIGVRKLKDCSFNIQGLESSSYAGCALISSWVAFFSPLWRPDSLDQSSVCFWNKGLRQERCTMGSHRFSSRADSASRNTQGACWEKSPFLPFLPGHPSRLEDLGSPRGMKSKLKLSIGVTVAKSYQNQQTLPLPPQFIGLNSDIKKNMSIFRLTKNSST